MMHFDNNIEVEKQMELSSALLKILVCPLTKASLIYDRDAEELISEAAGLAYPIRDGIPILLVDQARKINKNAHREFSQRVDYISDSQKED
jgi:uncharacterized protein YbaR (Trm112 family)